MHKWNISIIFAPSINNDATLVNILLIILKKDYEEIYDDGCLVATLISMESCKNKPETWEYKVVKVAGKEAEYREDFGSLVFSDQTAMLNKMVKCGLLIVLLM